MTAGKRVALRFLREILWWVVSALAIYAAMYPIWSKADFRFNGLFIGMLLLFFHYFRYIVSFSQFPLFQSNIVKFIWFTLNFPLFFLVMKQYQNIVGLFDSYNIFDFVDFFKKDLSPELRDQLVDYIFQVFILSSIGSAILIVVMQFRIGFSIFRKLRHKPHDNTTSPNT